MKRFNWMIVVFVLLALFASMSLSPRQVSAAGTGPCDIYAAGGTPCVAAHSTVRALFGSYNGNLYQVRRSSDNTTRNIGVLSAGGYANAAAQDSFCSGTSCVITTIYDQSGRGNHLTVAPAGGAGGADTPSNATAAQITINGNKAYGVFIAAGNGYRDNSTSGIATGDQPEGMYAVFDGTHFNGGCCFDYGNAETNNLDNGNGHMEAIYFGNIRVWTFGAGNGPWVMADLENGLFGCAASPNGSLCSNDPTVSFRYLTAIVKGQPNNFAIRAGNAQSGGLSTFYNGGRPNVSGYNPMHKEGAIILGIGGDNSKQAVGTFYEGAMTSGYPSDATENSVQSNIVAARYGSGGGPTPTPPPGGSFQIVSRNSGKCLDVNQASTADGANVQQWTCNGGNNQRWRIEDLGNGWSRIVSVNSGKVLDVNGCGTADGTNIQQWSWLNNNCQQFQLVTTSSPWFRIVNRNSNKVADVINCQTNDGANVRLWTWLNNNCQQWQLVQ